MTPALILFDIDGTLLLSGRAGLRAMTRAFEQTFGVANAFASASFGGRTDSFLVSYALRPPGCPTRRRSTPGSATSMFRCSPRRFSIPAPATRD